jgi:peptide/nickel transport system permease protein
LGKFLLRRALYLAVLVLIATSATYFLAAAALNPRSNFEGRNPAPSEESIDRLLNDLNLNNKTPVIERFGRWANGVRHRNLGATIDGDSVNAEMGRRVGVSLRLLLIGSLLGALCGIAAGAYSAVKQYGFSDHAMTLLSFVILSVPTVVLAVLLANAGASFSTPASIRPVSIPGPSPIPSIAFSTWFFHPWSSSSRDSRFTAVISVIPCWTCWAAISSVPRRRRDCAVLRR